MRPSLLRRCLQVFTALLAILNTHIHAAPGELIKEFPLSPTTFIPDPNLNQVYIGLQNGTIVPVDLRDFSLGNPIAVSGVPASMAFSRDKQTLYVTLSNRSAVFVVDVASWNPLPEIPFTRPGDQIAVDWRNRLFVGSVDRNEDIMVYDPSTGSVTEPFEYYCRICYRPLLQMSEDGKTLYGGNRGISSASLVKYDVTDDVPAEIWYRRDLGGNGQDLHLTADNTSLYYAVGSGNGALYDVGKIDPIDNAVVGYMETGPYPREITTSPDGRFLYAVHTSGHIDVWNVDSLAQITQYDTEGEAFELGTDFTGDYLIAAFTDSLRIYEAEGTVVVTDDDNDGINDVIDNCIDEHNPGQHDSDSDGSGDVCDPFPDEANHEYAYCAADLEASQEELFSVMDTVALLQQDNSQLSQQVAEAWAEVDALDSTNAALNQQVTSLSSQISQQASELSACQSTVSDQQNTVVGLETQIALLNDRVAELEQELANQSQPKDTDQDGVVDEDDQCQGTTPGVPVDLVGCPVPLSQLIQAEDYVRYWDSTGGNSGGRYRTDDVDIEVTSDTNGGFNVGWTSMGEWLEYDTTLHPGTYTIRARVASNTSTAAFSIELDQFSSGGQYVGNTGGWQSWRTVNVGTVTVDGSSHTLRLNVTGNNVNVNWIELNYQNP